jgi:hypothetical protein
VFSTISKVDNQADQQPNTEVNPVLQRDFTHHVQARKQAQ